MSNRILDITTIDKLSMLVEIAKNQGFSISLDFIGYSKKSTIPDALWIAQMYDEQERIIVSANSQNANEAIKKLYQNWLAKTAPRL